MEAPIPIAPKTPAKNSATIVAFRLLGISPGVMDLRRLDKTSGSNWAKLHKYGRQHLVTVHVKQENDYLRKIS